MHTHIGCEFNVTAKHLKVHLKTLANITLHQIFLIIEVEIFLDFFRFLLIRYRHRMNVERGYHYYHLANVR